jgi:tetratricopeptide (TPR) repeat protein
MRLKRYLLIGLSLIISGALFSQSVVETYDYAKKQFEEANYELSIKSLHRVIYFGGDEYLFDCSLMLAECYNAIGEAEKALPRYDIAYNLTQDDSVRNEITFRKTASLILLEKYNHALMELYSLDDNLNSYFNDKYSFYMSLIHFRKGDFDLAFGGFESIIPSTDIEGRQRIADLKKECEKIDRINPNTAQWLSLLLPGLGQLYVGEYDNALNSFLINAAFATLYFTVIKSYSLLDGILSIYPWFQRYYIGGFQNAKRLAVEVKDNRRRLVLREVLLTVSESKK